MDEKMLACALVLATVMPIALPFALNEARELVRVNRKPRRIAPSEPVFIQPKVRRA